METQFYNVSLATATCRPTGDISVGMHGIHKLKKKEKKVCYIKTGKQFTKPLFIPNFFDAPADCSVGF